MEIKEDYCLGMTEDGAVVRIRKKDGMKVGRRIYILREDLRNKEENVQKISEKGKKIISWKIMTVAAAVLAAVIGLTLVIRISSVPYAVVAVDGQRSIQFELDEKHTVKKAVSYNHSFSQKSLEKLEGKKLEEAGEILKQTKSFPDEEHRIIGYGFYEENQKEAENFEKLLQKVLGNAETVYMQGTVSDVEQAKKEKKPLSIFLLEKAAKGEQLEEILEEFPPEKAAKFLKQYPELATFSEIFEED
ncbi:MAG: anti-sigma factor domain-containing protein, partial [Blautia sp.]